MPTEWYCIPSPGFRGTVIAWTFITQGELRQFMVEQRPQLLIKNEPLRILVADDIVECTARCSRGHVLTFKRAKEAETPCQLPR